MSERKRERKKKCMMCHVKDAHYHGKCLDCRANLQYNRYANKNKLNKFKRNK